jgi:hypothetical protein
MTKIVYRWKPKNLTSRHYLNQKFIMKKFNLDPLALDKETIARLDEKQLQAIVGGNYEAMLGTSTGCGDGGSTCGTGGGSTGCGSGGSTCLAEPAL